MPKNKIFIWISGIGLLLLVLIVIQFIWLRDASKAQERETKMYVLRALEQAEQKLRNTNYCYEMYGKTYIGADEAFYMVRQKWDSSGTTGAVDTVQLYYDLENYMPDTVLYQTRTIHDGWPLSAEIHLNFTFSEPQDTAEFNKERKEFYEKITGKRMRDIISNKKPVESVFRMKTVDSILAQSLKEQHIKDTFAFGFIDDKLHTVAYAQRVSDSAALLHSPYNILLFTENKFLKPYRLALLFPVPPAVFGDNFWLILSIAIIIILILSFYSFIRLYIKQTRLSEMKSDFINNLTHEFNTPMANISLAIESLDEGGQSQPPKLKQMLDIISSESARLRENIERALQVATMEKGNLHFRMEEVDLVAMINTVLATYQLQCEQLGGTIKFIHPAKAKIYGDETHLLNCVCNLLDNAIKYRKDIPVIEVFLEDRSANVVLSVTDNGIGMNLETQKLIFDKFYRAHQGNVHDTKGFGLGLSYVKGVIETHGGKISVVSKKGTGTKFIIQLPKKEIHEAN